MSDGLTPKETAAVRKMLFSLAGDEVDEEADVFEAVEATAQRVDKLSDRVAELERVVDPDPGAADYEQLTKPQKVHRIRVALLEQAADGKPPSMKYKDVLWLFDGHPSAGHVYDLMERAANADGYYYDTNANDEKRIRVEPDGVNDESIVHAVNNGVEKTTA
jgi:hypothetical protein